MQGGKFPGRDLDQTEPQQLAPERLPGVALEFLADTVGRKFVMPPLPNRLRIAAGQHFDDVVKPESEAALLLHAQNAGEKFLRRHRAIEGLARVETVVAAIAGFVRPFLRKIAQERGAPAFSGLGVMHHLAQLFARDPRFALAFFLDETRLFHHIAGAEEEHAIARQPVASGPPGFLIIALDVLRQVVVHDEADVRLVDPHPEGDRRAHHAHVVAQEHLLILRALFRFQAGVIRLRRDAVGVQFRGDGLGGLAARAINDPAVVRPALQELEQLIVGRDFGTTR